MKVSDRRRVEWREWKKNKTDGNERKEWWEWQSIKGVACFSPKSACPKEGNTSSLVGCHLNTKELGNQRLSAFSYRIDTAMQALLPWWPHLPLKRIVCLLQHQKQTIVTSFGCRLLILCTPLPFNSHTKYYKLSTSIKPFIHRINRMVKPSARNHGSSQEANS